MSWAGPEQGVHSDACDGQDKQSCNPDRGCDPFVLLDNGNDCRTIARLAGRGCWGLMRRLMGLRRLGGESGGGLSTAARSRLALQAPEVGPHFRSDLIAEITIFLERLADDLLQLRGRSGLSRKGRRGGRFRMPSKMVADVSPRNGRCP